MASKIFAHFRLFVDEGRRVVRVRVNFTREGRRRLMLAGSDARKEVLILFQPKVSIAFGKHSCNLTRKVTRVNTCFDSLLALRVVYLEFRI